MAVVVILYFKRRWLEAKADSSILFLMTFWGKLKASQGVSVAESHFPGKLLDLFFVWLKGICVFQFKHCNWTVSLFFQSEAIAQELTD